MSAHRYFFILGTNHTLAKVDVVNVLSRRKVKFRVLEASEEALVIETVENTDLASFFTDFGSVVKAGEIFDLINEVKVDSFRQTPVTGKLFGISTYNGGGGFKKLNNTFYQVPKIGRTIKDATGVSFLSTRERQLPSFLVDKRELINDGFELVMIVGSTGIYLGQTKWLQDYEGYSKRDYGRPARDAQSGMVPPKLAKIMINLAGKSKENTFLDPFCGSGTFLQEMILLGYKNITGADLEDKAIAATRQNLDWLFEQYPLNKKDYELEIIKSDVRQIASHLVPQSIDSIVTEPYLGSPEAKNFSLARIREEVNLISPLYLEAFNQFNLVLAKEGVVVIIFPVFRFGSTFTHLEILERIKEMGFEQRDLLLTKPEGDEKLRLNLTRRGSVVYYHPGQSISREIFVFQKVSLLDRQYR